MFYRGGFDFATRHRYHYHYLVMLFGLREFDFDKRSTTMGI
jgi:hypothetical protein